VNFGPVGGAAVWAALNVGYIILTPQLMHRRLLAKEKLAWYWAGVLVPTLVSCGVFLVLNQIPLEGVSRLTMAVILLFYWAVASMATLLSLPRLRGRVTPWLGSKLRQLGIRKMPD
jgi:hypothetical protein